MKDFKNLAKWALIGTIIISFSYVVSMIVLLIIHGSFGYSMNDDGDFLSNALMHIGSGIIIATGTGIYQRELLKKYLHVPFSWIWALIIGFTTAESIAGLILWKSEIYRGLINVFNSTNHLPEALIFSTAGLFAGFLQFIILKPFYSGRLYWIAASMLGWSLFILSAYIGLLGLLLGILVYCVITGWALFWLMKPKFSTEIIA